MSPGYSYYSGHGDLAAEANHSGVRTRLIRLDPWGQPLASSGTGLQELYTGRWDTKHDLTTNLIEMGVRPYDPALGRFLSVDPIDGGSCNNYEYACQDPVNGYDLNGKASSNAYTIADGGGCWATCGYWSQYTEKPKSSLRKNLAKEKRLIGEDLARIGKVRLLIIPLGVYFPWRDSYEGHHGR